MLKAGDHIDKEQLKKFFGRSAAIAEAIALWTPNEADDRIVAFAKATLERDEVLDAILWALHLFEAQGAGAAGAMAVASAVKADSKISGT